MPKHRSRELTMRLSTGSTAVVAAALLLVSTSCFEPTSETPASTTTGTTSDIPTLAEIQSKVGLTSDQRTALAPAHERWRQAEQTLNAGGAAPESPEMEFIAESATVLSRDQLLQLITMLHDRLANRLGRLGNEPPPGAGPGGPAGPHGMGRMGGRHHGPGRPGPGTDPFANLGLSDAQRAAIDSAAADLHATLRSLHEQFRNGQITQEQLDAALRAAHDQFTAALRQILTAEQWAELQETKRQELVQRLAARLATFDDHAAHVVSMLDRILGLDDQQVAAVRGVLQETKTQLTNVLTGLQNGDLSLEAARSALEQIHENTGAGIRATLTDEQAQVFDALHTLRPPHGPPLP